MELIDIIPEFNLYEEFWKIYTNNSIIPPQYISKEAVIDRSITDAQLLAAADALVRNGEQKL